MTHDVAPGLFRRGRGWVIAVAVAFALVLGAIMGTKYLARALPSGEYVCGQGEVPIDGGLGCLPEGEPLPEGAMPDPLGNRPLECGRGHGWIEVENVRTQELDCLKEGRPLPRGWRESED